MKTLYFLPSLLVLILLVACSPANRMTDSDAETEVLESQFQGTPEDRLVNWLQKQAGVTISGNAPNYVATIRAGVNSFNSNSRPLYVVNGNPAGYDFSAAAQMVGTNPIKRIKVLKDSETTLYGLRGAGGVFEITTTTTTAKR